MIGQFYPFIVKLHGNCSIQMSISGSASGTGKSLMQSSCTLMFTGEQQTAVTSISEAALYEMLSEGCIYGNDNYIDIDFALIGLQIMYSFKF